MHALCSMNWIAFMERKYILFKLFVPKPLFLTEKKLFFFSVSGYAVFFFCFFHFCGFTNISSPSVLQREHHYTSVARLWTVRLSVVTTTDHTEVLKREIPKLWCVCVGGGGGGGLFKSFNQQTRRPWLQQQQQQNKQSQNFLRESTPGLHSLYFFCWAFELLWASLCVCPERDQVVLMDLVNTDLQRSRITIVHTWVRPIHKYVSVGELLLHNNKLGWQWLCFWFWYDDTWQYNETKNHAWPWLEY